MQERMKNPAVIIPEAMPAIQALAAATRKGGVPEPTLALVHLRVSQVNGCSACVQGGSAQARKAGESEDRLADRPDPVPDAIWDEAARHYDEQGLAALLLSIATANVFNRLNLPTRQVAGAWG
jgi:AhpD family alkylhydroperoxidase